MCKDNSDITSKKRTKKMTIVSTVIDIYNILLSVVMLMIGVWFIIAGINGDESIALSVFGCIICWTISFFILAFEWCCMASKNVKLSFSTDGIVVRYPFHKSDFVNWSEIQEVCICYGGYSTRGEKKASTIICIVKNGEKKNFYHRWKVDNPFHYKGVMYKMYTDDLFREISDVYPNRIVDLRNTTPYKF